MRNMLVLLVLLGMSLTVARAADNSSAMPKEAMWTIYCRSYGGMMRLEEAQRARDAMARLTGWKDWFIIHNEDESTLYYGRYRAISPRSAESKEERQEAERAQQDLKRVKALQDSEGKRVFDFCLMVEIPQPGSEGPREWDIKNTPPDRYWSLLIGVYRDNPERKKAAVEAVRQLRAEGTEAYYMHQPTSSLVCVGAWPRSAIKEQDTDTAEPNDPDTQILVYNVPIPKNHPREFIGLDGKRVRVFAPEVEIENANMQSTVDRYPYFHTNGEVLGKRYKDRSGTEKVAPDQSQLMIIPHKNQGDFGTEETPNQPRPDVVKQLTQPKPKDEAGAGKLKSLGD